MPNGTDLTEHNSTFKGSESLFNLKLVFVGQLVNIFVLVLEAVFIPSQRAFELGGPALWERSETIGISQRRRSPSEESFLVNIVTDVRPTRVWIVAVWVEACLGKSLAVDSEPSTKALRVVFEEINTKT